VEFLSDEFALWCVVRDVKVERIIWLPVSGAEDGVTKSLREAVEEIGGVKLARLIGGKIFPNLMEDFFRKRGSRECHVDAALDALERMRRELGFLMQVTHCVAERFTLQITDFHSWSETEHRRWFYSKSLDPELAATVQAWALSHEEPGAPPMQDGN
jgi:hypothetical protein